MLQSFVCVQQTVELRVDLTGRGFRYNVYGVHPVNLADDIFSTSTSASLIRLGLNGLDRLASGTLHTYSNCLL